MNVTTAPFKFLLAMPDSGVYLDHQVSKHYQLDLGSEEWHGSSRGTGIFRSMFNDNMMHGV